jgi:type VI secretion system secreted protein VgrG
LFITTLSARGGAAAEVKEMHEVTARLEESHKQHEALANLAQQHEAQDAKVGQHDAAQTIQAQNKALEGEKYLPPEPKKVIPLAEQAKGGEIRAGQREVPFPEMTRPDIVMASAAGIATSAAEGTHQASVHDHAITAGRDVSLSAGRSLLVSVLNAISLFAQEGIRVISKGRVDIRSNTAGMGLAAQQDMTLASAQGQIQASAKSRILLESGGAFVKLDGAGNVIVGGPGKLIVQMELMEKDGAVSNGPTLPVLPDGNVYNGTFILKDKRTNEIMRNHKFRIRRADGSYEEGVTDENGQTHQVITHNAEQIELHDDDGE